jgi:hypothetical protein
MHSSTVNLKAAKYIEMLSVKFIVFLLPENLTAYQVALESIIACGEIAGIAGHWPPTSRGGPSPHARRVDILD